MECQNGLAPEWTLPTVTTTSTVSGYGWWFVISTTNQTVLWSTVLTLTLAYCMFQLLVDIPLLMWIICCISTLNSLVLSKLLGEISRPSYTLNVCTQWCHLPLWTCGSVWSFEAERKTHVVNLIISYLYRMAKKSTEGKLDDQLVASPCFWASCW